MVDDVQAAIRTEGARLTHAFLVSTGKLSEQETQYRTHVWVSAIGTIYASLASVYGADSAEMLWAEGYKLGKEYAAKPPAAQ